MSATLPSHHDPTDQHSTAQHSEKHTTKLAQGMAGRVDGCPAAIRSRWSCHALVVMTMAGTSSVNVIFSISWYYPVPWLCAYELQPGMKNALRR